MAKELFNSDFYTLPEQVQINKEDIETNTEKIATNTANIATNTSDITKLQDDISKIKPNAWEERKFNLNIGSTEAFECSTYNPITNESNPIVNIQKAFTDKDTYETTDAINSSSFSVSIPSLNLFAYSVCADPSLTLIELFDMSTSTTVRLKNKIVFMERTDDDGNKIYTITINCDTAYIGKLSFHRNDSVDDIDRISDDDDKSEHSLLTAKAVDQYYLKKTDASNTYVTKQDYDKRFDTGVIALTEEGFNKIKAMAEEVGTTITLTATTDFSENIQLTNTKELILNVTYNGNNIYRNIHLVPNQSIDDYDAYQDASESTCYTGHAMLSLPSLDNGYFLLSYQNGTHSQLILHMIQHI